jgi:uncharacterized membrane protein YeaQ/YmgE (transglycosylase-associated protein family)
LGFLGAIFVGGLAGWIAGMTLNRRHGLLFNLLSGLAGSFLGAFLARRLDVHILPGLASSLVLSTVGAVLLLTILGLFRRRG